MTIDFQGLVFSVFVKGDNIHAEINVVTFRPLGTLQVHDHYYIVSEFAPCPGPLSETRIS